MLLKIKLLQIGNSGKKILTITNLLIVGYYKRENTFKLELNDYVTNCMYEFCRFPVCLTSIQIYSRSRKILGHIYTSPYKYPFKKAGSFTTKFRLPLQEIVLNKQFKKNLKRIYFLCKNIFISLTQNSQMSHWITFFITTTNKTSVAMRQKTTYKLKKRDI